MNEYWLRNELLEELPSFKCAECNYGNLVFSNDQILEKKSPYGEDCYEATGDPACYWSYFTAIGLCSSEECRESTIVSGIKKNKENGYEEGDEWPSNSEYGPFPLYKWKYKINYIDPGPYIIDLPSRLEKEVISVLRKSFSLFWVDTDSCANKIRHSLEVFLTTQNIVRYTINNKNKRASLSLHSRIDKFIKLTQN